MNITHDQIQIGAIVALISVVTLLLVLAWVQNTEHASDRKKLLGRIRGLVDFQDSESLEWLQRKREMNKRIESKSSTIAFLRQEIQDGEKANSILQKMYQGLLNQYNKQAREHRKLLITHKINIT